MKKFDFLVCFLIIAFLISYILGVYFQIYWLAGLFLGLTFGVIFLTYFIMNVVAFVKALKIEKQLTPETKQELVDKVNSTYGIENGLRYKECSYINLIHLYKSSNIKECILKIMAVVLMLSLLIVGIVFCCLNYLLAGIICIVCYVLIYIIFIILRVIDSRLKLSRKGADYSNLNYKATVISCTGSQISIRNTFGAIRIYEFIYKIKVNFNGKEKITYSKKFYNTGETVNILTDMKKKKVFIAD